MFFAGGSIALSRMFVLPFCKSPCLGVLPTASEGKRSFPEFEGGMFLCGTFGSKSRTGRDSAKATALDSCGDLKPIPDALRAGAGILLSVTGSFLDDTDSVSVASTPITSKAMAQNFTPNPDLGIDTSSRLVSSAKDSLDKKFETY